MSSGKLRGCLVSVFKQQFSVFKQHFTYFNTLFHPHVFPQKFSNNNFQFLNTCTRFEKWSSDKVFVFVDARESERVKERQVQCTSSRITHLLKVKRNRFESVFIMAQKLRARDFPLVCQENPSTVRFPSCR